LYKKKKKGTKGEEEWRTMAAQERKVLEDSLK
jgi:hypothetical protein